jgi:hypothetical protein
LISGREISIATGGCMQVAKASQQHLCSDC